MAAIRLSSKYACGVFAVLVVCDASVSVPDSSDSPDLVLRAIAQTIWLTNRLRHSNEEELR